MGGAQDLVPRRRLRELSFFDGLAFRRDLRDLESIIQTVNDKGASISFLFKRLIFKGDTDDAFSRLQLLLMGAFAEFERSIIRKRQAGGIAKAKARGVYKGGKKTVDDAKILDLKGRQVKRVSEIVTALGVSRMTLYLALECEEKPHKN